MTKNPFINALSATLYIVLVVSLMQYGPLFSEAEGSMIIPVAVLSLFVFSASVMGFVFLYRPLQLFLEGRRKEAVTLFLTTVAAFAGSTVALVCAWFFLGTFIR